MISKKQRSSINKLRQATNRGRIMIDDVLEIIRNQVDNQQVNIYEPEENEVINGLFFRVLRFYHSYVISFHFWAEDMHRIITRTIIESFIYLSYLINTNKKEIYLEFIKYGIGQEKLYKLQLAKLIEEKKIQPSSEIIDYINSDSDEEIWDELISIKLKNFEDLRKLSNKINESELYSIKYQPYSDVIHGHWMALKKYYLKKCSNPMHRFHYIPNFILPNINPIGLVEITNLFYQCYLLWIKKNNFENKIEKVIDSYLNDLNQIFSI